jgi:hypothetical protein
MSWRQLRRSKIEEKTGRILLLLWWRKNIFLRKLKDMLEGTAIDDHESQ